MSKITNDALTRSGTDTL